MKTFLSLSESSVYGSRRSPGLRDGEAFLAYLSRLPVLLVQDSGCPVKDYPITVAGPRRIHTGFR